MALTTEQGFYVAGAFVTALTIVAAGTAAIIGFLLHRQHAGVWSNTLIWATGSLAVFVLAELFYFPGQIFSLFYVREDDFGLLRTGWIINCISLLIFDVSQLTAAAAIIYTLKDVTFTPGSRFVDQAQFVLGLGNVGMLLTSIGFSIAVISNIGKEGHTNGGYLERRGFYYCPGSDPHYYSSNPYRACSYHFLTPNIPTPATRTLPMAQLLECVAQIPLIMMGVMTLTQAFMRRVRSRKIWSSAEREQSQKVTNWVLIMCILFLLSPLYRFIEIQLYYDYATTGLIHRPVYEALLSALFEHLPVAAILIICVALAYKALHGQQATKPDETEMHWQKRKTDSYHQSLRGSSYHQSLMGSKEPMRGSYQPQRQSSGAYQPQQRQSSGAYYGQGGTYQSVAEGEEDAQQAMLDYYTGRTNTLPKYNR